jgi:hypothetical protein
LEWVLIRRTTKPWKKEIGWNKISDGSSPAPQGAKPAASTAMIFWKAVKITQIHSPNQSQVKRAKMTLNDLEFAYAPVRDQVRDLREYL